MKRMTGLVLLAGLLPLPSMAATFEEIMASISKGGSLSNGDGHQWTFKQRQNAWSVEGAQGRSATVTASGENQVKIDGFPANWNANGLYKFAQDGTKCSLASTSSRHKLAWAC
jgi:hypothetical protein